ncbi:MAG: ribosomal protein S18-alanine N-acetyltransferase [Gallionellaceae bacterium]|jgi:ribosomal-protein-alanine N-acetyltransferase
MKLRAMLESDIESVLQIEQQIHAHPWTRGNFSDALTAGYICQLLDFKCVIAGYVILMQGVDDAELLNIGVALQYQRQGFGRQILQAMMVIARKQDKHRIVLEVRASNAPAIGLYQALGFSKIGLRRNYYVVENGREDAILMGLEW